MPSFKREVISSMAALLGAQSRIFLAISFSAGPEFRPTVVFKGLGLLLKKDCTSPQIVEVFPVPGGLQCSQYLPKRHKQCPHPCMRENPSVRRALRIAVDWGSFKLYSFIVLSSSDGSGFTTFCNEGLRIVSRMS